MNISVLVQPEAMITDGALANRAAIAARAIAAPA